MNVLITDRFALEATALLKSTEGLAITQSDDPRPTSTELKNCEALIIRSRTPVDGEVLAQAPRLQIIITATSGFDHIDLADTLRRKIVVTHTPNANAHSAAELTWMLILALERRVLEAQRSIKAGDWKRDTLIGSEIAGKTLGIVGLGRIGSRVASIGQAFGCKTVAFDPYLESEIFAEKRAERVSFEELLKLSDIVSFHVPASPETELMLTAQDLQAMNRSAILINVARGSIVREKDLITALDAGWIRGLGLDVFEREPLARDSRLISFPNVVLSPHLGATTHQAFAAASLEAARKLISFVQTGQVDDRLPPTERWYQAGFHKS